VNEFSLESENPILYGIYLARNPELNQDEKDNIKYYMNKLIKNSRTLTKKFRAFGDIFKSIIIILLYT
jgi:hypothetical protein